MAKKDQHPQVEKLGIPEQKWKSAVQMLKVLPEENCLTKVVSRLVAPSSEGPEPAARRTENGAAATSSIKCLKGYIHREDGLALTTWTT